MARLALMLLSLFAFGCGSDQLPQRQCDPDRRCSVSDAPVCGDDGQWYECALVAQCEQVAVVFDGEGCDEPPPEPGPGCERIACSCEGGELVYGDSECPVGCECPPVDCPAIDLDCETEIGPSGCPECVPTDCPAGCTPDPDGGCDCEPLCGSAPYMCNDGCQVLLDSQGCEVCVCDPPPQCDVAFCDRYCPYGYLLGLDGCPTCGCYEPCQELPECDLACPNGYAVDPATSCQLSCECLADECPGFDCLLACEHGFRTTADGCETCDCKGAACGTSEDCAVNEVCVGGDFMAGECVALQECYSDEDCPGDRPCGFYYRQDCCPPLTTCEDNLPQCQSSCLLGVGDLPRDSTF